MFLGKTSFPGKQTGHAVKNSGRLPVSRLPQPCQVLVTPPLDSYGGLQPCPRLQPPVGAGPGPPAVTVPHQKPHPLLSRPGKAPTHVLGRTRFCTGRALEGLLRLGPAQPSLCLGCTSGRPESLLQKLPVSGSLLPTQATPCLLCFFSSYFPFRVDPPSPVMLCTAVRIQVKCHLPVKMGRSFRTESQRMCLCWPPSSSAHLLADWGPPEASVSRSLTWDHELEVTASHARGKWLWR